MLNEEHFYDFLIKVLPDVLQTLMSDDKVDGYYDDKEIARRAVRITIALWKESKENAGELLRPT